MVRVVDVSPHSVESHPDPLVLHEYFRSGTSAAAYETCLQRILADRYGICCPAHRGLAIRAGGVGSCRASGRSMTEAGGTS